MPQVSYTSYFSENLKDDHPEMITCPYCENYADLYFTNYRRPYYRCSECDLIFQIILKSYDNVVASYKKNYFDVHSNDQFGGQRANLYDHILELISKRGGIGRLLDVGTGCGFFLVAARHKRWEVRGIEPSIQSAEVAQRQNGLDVFSGTLQQYDRDDRFDVITFINVLEHSTIPWLEIGRAKNLLRPGGLIYLRFPNGFLHSRLYRTAKKSGLGNSLRRFLVFHKYSFTPRYIRKLFHDHGFILSTIQNSPPSQGDPNKLFPDPILAKYLKQLIYSVSKHTEKLSRGQVFVGTSLEATAIKPKYPQGS
jgi:2-polyprenyl-3-methyl-5-hydroxy-6-metoxy-1,4-benzoquinol methylase